ncbi:TonB family protein [Nibribacter ruber]|uniref:TonB family protein n=1 Tax=Nibribacter ruber TaxID=2698458 RepID=A0A6P1P2N4_9BACT|nr:TonB family protein [Nibribacter ruber]QHL88632.1 TonB family protein [Nibribacter ruber]
MKRYFPLLLLVLLPFWVQAQTSSTYHQEILKHRAQEDSVFKYGEKSPLTPEAKDTFQALEYFPVKEAYRVKAKFVRTANEGVFKMPTTGARTPEYVKYGELHFNLNGQKLQLNAYQNQELMKQVQYANYLFIPFTDATTGQETYATGRYLDFSIPMGADSVWVDFNKAYNPYCAYSDGYSCPIPPKENKLPVRIEAGVKNYGKGEAGELVKALAKYPGGDQVLEDFLYRNFVMPLPARKAHLSGAVVFSFVVKPDGTLTDFEILQSVRSDVDSAVLKAARKMPNWEPLESAEEVKMTLSLQVPRGKPHQQNLTKAAY